MNILGVLSHPEFGPWAIGPLEIHSFGLVVAIGIVIGLLLAGRRGQRIIGVAPEQIHNFAIWMIIFGWCFSHVFAVLLYSPDQVVEDPLILFKFWGEISSVGGLVGAAIAFMIWARRNPELDHLKWVNIAMWSIPIGFFFGRVGCTLAFDHPGQKASEFGLWNWFHEATGGAVPELFPLAMEFPERWGGGIRHNLGFYEALLWLGLMILFLWLGRKPRRRGLYVWLLPILYAPFRFLLDFLRAMPDEVAFGGDPRYLGMTPAQYTSIAFLAVGIYLWYRLKDQPVEQWVIHDQNTNTTAPSTEGESPKKKKSKKKKKTE